MSDIVSPLPCFCPSPSLFCACYVRRLHQRETHVLSSKLHMEIK